jgi:hypothetical protein
MSLLNGCVWIANAFSGGAGPWTVNSAVGGYMTPAQAGAIDGLSYSYRADGESALVQWEIGYATSTVGGTVFTRRPVFTSNANGPSSTPVNFSGNPTIIFTELVPDFPLLNYAITAIVNGGTATATPMQASSILTPTSTIASATQNLPPTPGDAQQFRISTTHTIVDITMAPTDGSAIVGAPAGLAANTGCLFTYAIGPNTWYRTG